MVEYESSFRVGFRVVHKHARSTPLRSPTVFESFLPHATSRPGIMRFDVILSLGIDLRFISSPSLALSLESRTHAGHTVSLPSDVRSVDRSDRSMTASWLTRSRTIGSRTECSTSNDLSNRGTPLSTACLDVVPNAADSLVLRVSRGSRKAILYRSREVSCLGVPFTTTNDTLSTASKGVHC